MKKAAYSKPTVQQEIAALTRRFEAARLFFGHGTDSPRDEAAALVFHVLKLDHARWRQAYRRQVPAADLARIHALAERRISERVPLPYLTQEAWFAGRPFFVDQRVLVPRSPFAELIERRFRPWLRPAAVKRILDIGTGSGCIAIACAFAFPRAQVVATDISANALEVAAINVRRYRLAQRVRLLESDLFAAVRGRFDLIVSNPPYVAAQAIAHFPPEYRHEPRIALAAGRDGMETPARILQHASQFLAPDGLLAIEVGAGARLFARRFPQLRFVWPVFDRGGDGIALCTAADLRRC